MTQSEVSVRDERVLMTLISRVIDSAAESLIKASSDQTSGNRSLICRLRVSLKLAVTPQLRDIKVVFSCSALFNWSCLNFISQSALLPTEGPTEQFLLFKECFSHMLTLDINTNTVQTERVQIFKPPRVLEIPEKNWSEKETSFLKQQWDRNRDLFKKTKTENRTTAPL